MSRRNYKMVKCEHCKKVGKVEQGVPELNKRFGNPFYICKNCGEVSYDNGIIEPALLSPEQLRKYSKTQGNSGRWLLIWFGTLWTIFPVALMMGSFAMASLALIPAVMVLIWMLIKENKTLDESAYNKQVRNSMIRLLADEKYAGAILEKIKPAPNSAWETQRETFETGEISNLELKVLFHNINDGCPEKPFRTWLLVPAFGIGILIMFIIALISGKEAFVKEPEPLVIVDLREVDALGQAVTYATDYLLGPFATNGLLGDGYYLAVDEDGTYHVVFLPKDYEAEYRSLLNGTATENGEMFVINGYSRPLEEEVSQYAKETLVAMVNQYFEVDMMTVDMLPEDVLSPFVLSVKEWEEPSPEGLSEAGITCLIICIVELLIGLICYLLLNRQKRKEQRW